MRLCEIGRELRMLAALIAANAFAWALAWLAFSDRPVLLGVAMLAWVFGLRHAVDADHIAAIDNAVRKLSAAGGRPIAAGLYFSLGHSTVVIFACAALASMAAAVQGWMLPVQKVIGLIGAGISAVFLLGIAGANLLVLGAAWRDFARARRGRDSQALVPGPTGPLAMALRPMLRAVSRSWHMYPVGFLFAIGFDTATEIGLLGVSATQAAQGLKLWHTMIFPALFTAGMALVDAADSVLMVGVYDWAKVNPLRKLWYNLTITAATVVMAVVIGGIEALNLLADRLGLEGRVWQAIADLNDDLTVLGFIMVGTFVLCWLISMMVYRWKRFGEVVTGNS